MVLYQNIMNVNGIGKHLKLYTVIIIESMYFLELVLNHRYLII
jgi:hypothetical protein